MIEASSDNMTYISKVKDTDILRLDNTKARALLDPIQSYTINFDDMTFSAEDLPDEEGEGKDPITSIQELLNSGSKSIKEIKSTLKKSIKGKVIDKLLSEGKNTLFRFEMKGEDWFIHNIAKAGAEPIPAEEHVYVMDEPEGHVYSADEVARLF